MLKIYKALRDAEYMANEGAERASVFGAIIEAIDIAFRMRRFCTLGVHIRLDVWDHRCWHERINDKIERLEERRVWGNPDITWSAQDWDDDLDRWMADEVEDFAPVTEVPESWGWQEDGTYVPSPGLRGFQDGIEYHPWRHG